MASLTASAVIKSVEMSVSCSLSRMSSISKCLCTGLFDSTVSNHSFFLSIISFSLKIYIILLSVSLVGYLTINSFISFTQK